LKEVSMGDEVMIMDKLNSRPRKCLDFRTPYEVFFEHQPVALTTYFFNAQAKNPIDAVAIKKWSKNDCCNY